MQLTPYDDFISVVNQVKPIAMSSWIDRFTTNFFFIFVAAPKGVQGYVFIGLNQFTYHHRSNRSRWPGLVQLGAPPSPRLESQLLAVRGGRGVVVKMEAL